MQQEKCTNYETNCCQDHEEKGIQGDVELSNDLGHILREETMNVCKECTVYRQFQTIVLGIAIGGHKASRQAAVIMTPTLVS